MPAKNTGTEQLIKDTAKRIFFKEGKLHATTQDIADAAGVNRALLHYYFRSRDQLVAAVFQESMLNLSASLGAAMVSAKPFREKVEALIDIFLADMLVYPYQETFMITEINTAGQQLLAHIDTGPTQIFLTEIQQEMDKGTIEPMAPAHFLMNLFALLSYPLVMAPVYRRLFNLPAGGFDQLMHERKTVINRMIFKAG